MTLQSDAGSRDEVFLYSIDYSRAGVVFGSWEGIRLSVSVLHKRLRRNRPKAKGPVAQTGPS